MGKRISARKIKADAQYTYEEAAGDLDVSVQTVRAMRAAGLEVLDSQKPHLILGFMIKAFLESRQKPKRKLAPDEFLCMTCHAHRRAYGGMVDYIPINDQKGRLETLCEVCHGPCTKFSSPAQCAKLARILSIVTRDT